MTKAVGSVRRVTQWLLWLFIFSVPWGIVSSVPGIGTITRLLGIVTIGVGALTVVAEGRIRKPGLILSFASVFAMSSVLSLFWTISYGYTAERVGTYIQLVALIWLVREFAQTREEQHSLRLAFCLGALVFAFDVLRNFSAGIEIESRFSASGVNPNFVGFVLVTGFPMAWHLFLHHRGTVRVVSSLYCLVAPATVLLTGSRSAFLALLVAASIVPLTLRRNSFSFWLKVAVVMFGAVVTVGLVVPRQSWDRLLAITQELESGTIAGRTQIWEAGVPLFQERPFLGAGAGAFPAAVEPILDTEKAAHNMLVSLLVEQGIVGLCLFVSLLAACAWIIISLPSPDRKLWAASMVAWLIFAMSHDSHADRVTWVVFGLLAAQESIKTGRVHVSRREPARADWVIGEAFVPSALARHEPQYRGAVRTAPLRRR